MKTREFFRRSIHIYCYVAALFLAGASALRWSVEQVSVAQALGQTTVYIIDAGHGGMDSGASAADGTPESGLNLQIARRLNTLLRLFGCRTQMTRETEQSLENEGETIRQKKQSDLNNRVTLVNGTENALLVSIHQNFFSDSRYSGVQVFYAGNGDARLAEGLQSAANRFLTPGTNREAKPAEGVYLMRKVHCPAILIECGFLSNPAELQNLKDAAYQKRLCAVIAAQLMTWSADESPI